MVMEIPILTPQEKGRRLKQLRLLAEVTQEALAAAIGYKEGTASGVSKIEAGNRTLTEIARRRAANFLADKGDLCEDAAVLEGYLVGDHDSLDACLLRGRDSNPQPSVFKPLAA